VFADLAQLVAIGAQSAGSRGLRQQAWRRETLQHEGTLLVAEQMTEV
jgi:hypothetical protein